MSVTGQHISSDDSELQWYKACYLARPISLWSTAFPQEATETYSNPLLVFHYKFFYRCHTQINMSILDKKKTPQASKYVSQKGESCCRLKTEWNLVSRGKIKEHIWKQFMKCKAAHCGCFQLHGQRFPHAWGVLLSS